MKEDIYSEARDRLKRAVDGSDYNREFAVEDVHFRNGDQWPDKVKKDRERAARPVLTFNHMEGFIDQVKGDQRQNKIAIKVNAVDGKSIALKGQNLAGTKDYKLAEVYNGLIKNIEYTSRAHIAYNTAFDHAIGHGFGYMRLVTEYSDDDSFDQDIRIKRIPNSFTVYLDPDSQEPDGSDAKFCFVAEYISKQEYEKKYQDKAPIGNWSARGWNDQGRGEDYELWFDDNKVRVVEYYRKVPIKVTIGKLQNGEVVRLGRNADEVEATKAEHALNGNDVVQTRLVDSHKIEYFVVSAAGVVGDRQEWAGKFIPVIPVYGKELNVMGKRILRGVIRHAKDAQMNYNYWETAATEQVALSPKAPWKLTPKQIEGFESYWAEANTENLPYLLFNPDPEFPGAPIREQPPSMPVGAIERKQSARQDMMFTTGIHEGGLGAKSNETSGRAILARQREGDTGTYEFHDNLAISISHVGRCLLDLIPKIYDTERVVRIKNFDETEDYVMINHTMDDGTKMHDLSVGKYDVTVSTGPSYNTQRQESADAMIEMTKANPQMWNILGDLIAEAMDWSNADKMADRLRKMLPPGLLEKDEEEQEQEEPQQPSPEEQAAMAKSQADIAKAQADVEKAKADTVKAQADIEIAALKVEQEKIKLTNQQTDNRTGDA